MPRPVHFEIPAENPQRAIAFYQGLFGWQFHQWNGPEAYWIINTGPDSEPGIHGGLLRRRDPNQPCVNTIGVPDIDASLAQAAKTGGVCVVPKMAVPGVGWLAYCKDPEGNIFGMMQNAPSAK